MPTLTYDADADVALIQLVVPTDPSVGEIAPGILLDYDTHGMITEIRITQASQRLAEGALAEFEDATA